MVKRNIGLVDFEKNTNIGLYIFANDKFCLVGKNVSLKKRKKIEEILNVEVFEISLLGTNLIGLFLCGNNEFLIIPKIEKEEFLKLEKICKKFKVKLIEIKNYNNTFGNLICVSKNEFLINKKYKKIGEEIKDKTELNEIEIESEIFESVGSVSVCIKNKFFLSQNFEEKVLSKIPKKLICEFGSVNLGSDFVKSGIVGNKFGILIGKNSSTIEIQNIIESFKFL